MDLTEKTLESREVYRGRILRVREDRVLLPNGQEAQREIVEHPGGVGILALDADGCAVMVRQYRYAFGQTLLEIHLHTGRHHQIRAQLAAIGCPIVGDVKYGASLPLPDASIALHARSLSLTHPVRREPITFIAPLPSASVWDPVRDL